MFLDLIKKRRSIRKYTDKVPEKDLIEQIATAALYAPTARNLDSVKLVIVTDKDELSDLSRFKSGGAEMLAEAQAAIAVVSDPTVGPQTHRQDAAIAASYILLAATDLGIGSCWVNVNSAGEEAIENAHKLLGLDPDLNIESIVSLGYPAEDPGEKIPRDIESHLIWK